MKCLSLERAHNFHIFFFNLLNIDILFEHVFRCTDIGKYAMMGTNVNTCVHSEWTGHKPVCLGLNQENDYASEFLLLFPFCLRVSD